MLLSFFAWLAIWVMVTAIMEYLIHRHAMHKRRWWLPNWVFQDHTIEHHINDRKDTNIDLPVHYHLIIGSPLIAWACFMGRPCLLALLGVFMFHSYVWTKVHRGIHGLEQNWLMRTKYYKRAKKHHELHHQSWGKNFGIVFPFTDILFRTKIK